MKTKNFESFNWKNNYIFVHVVQAKHVVLEAYLSEQGQKDFFKVNGWNVWSGYGGHWFLSYRPIIISIWGNTIKQQIYDLYYHVSTSTQVKSTACRESGHKRLHCLVLCSLFLGERRKSGQEQPAKWEKDSKRGGEKASSKGQWLTIGRRLGPRFVTLPLLWNLLSCSFTSCQATIVTSFHCHPLHRSWRVTFSLADLFTWFLHLSSVVISRRLRGALILDGLVFVSLDVIIQAKDFHCDNTLITLIPPPPLATDLVKVSSMFGVPFICVVFLFLRSISFMLSFPQPQQCTAQQTLGLSPSALFCFNFLPLFLGIINNLCNKVSLGFWVWGVQPMISEYHILLMTMVTGKQQ